MVKALNQNMKRPSSDRGFTLMEVALAVVIGGMLLAMFGQSLMNTIQESKIKTTQVRIAEINNALRRHAAYSNHLPCPADRTLVTTAATYGTAVANCGVGIAATGTVSDGGVRVGMVPTRTLNLPDEYGYDGWGMRLIYAVTEKMASTATYDTTAACNTAAGQDPNNQAHKGGACAIVSGNPTRAAYVVVSTGNDRQGSFTTTGAQGPACAVSAGADSENCDDDATFSDALQTSALGATFFDDYIVYQSLQEDIDEIPEGAIVAFRLSTCPKGWDQIPEMEGSFPVGRGAFANPAPSKTAAAYGSKTYLPGQSGGSATRWDDAPGALTGVSEYRNFAPYIAYTYCVKS